MSAQPFAFGPAMNDAFINHWFSIPDAYRKIFVIGAGIPGFENGLTSSKSLFILYVLRRAYADKTGVRQQELNDAALVGMVAEGFVPGIPDERKIAPTEALALIEELVSQYLINTDKTHMSTCTTLNVAEILAAHGSYTAIDVSGGITTAQCWDILNRMADAASSSAITNGVTVLAHFIVAFLKRGNFSIQFLEKVASGIQDQFTVRVTFREYALKTLASQFGNYVNENNAAAFIEGLKSLLPVASHVRLGVTIEQAAGLGLTSICLIARVTRDHNRFKWEQVLVALASDTLRVHTAITTIGDNKYYGFARSMGPAKATNYAALGWVAKTLELRSNPASSFRGYGGLQHGPQGASRFVAMIDAYITAYNSAELGADIPDYPVCDGRQYTRLRAAFDAHSDVYYN